MKKMVKLFGFVAMTFFLFACGNGDEAEGDVYTGSAEGFGGTLTVEVTLLEDTITSVQVTDHSETQGYGTEVIDRLPDEIVSANSTDVDVVTGGTATSEAILEAVENAIESSQNSE